MTNDELKNFKNSFEELFYKWEIFAGILWSLFKGPLRDHPALTEIPDVVKEVLKTDVTLLDGLLENLITLQGEFAQLETFLHEKITPEENK